MPGEHEGGVAGNCDTAADRPHEHGIDNAAGCCRMLQQSLEVLGVSAPQPPGAPFSATRNDRSTTSAHLKRLADTWNEANGYAPVLAMCRKLVGAGVDERDDTQHQFMSSLAGAKITPPTTSLPWMKTKWQISGWMRCASAATAPR